MGLQAGAEYSLRIALSNVFGTEWVNATARPLLGELVWGISLCVFLLNSPPTSPSGHPSTPQVTLTPTAGSLRVQLTTMYPGTRESTLQYSISTPTSPRSRRQTGQQTLPVTDLTTPVSGSEEVALGPGTYSVTVTVTNQHGDITSVPQEVTVPGWPLAHCCWSESLLTACDVEMILFQLYVTILIALSAFHIRMFVFLLTIMYLLFDTIYCSCVSLLRLRLYD